MYPEDMPGLCRQHIHPHQYRRQHITRTTKAEQCTMHMHLIRIQRFSPITCKNQKQSSCQQQLGAFAKNLPCLFSIDYMPKSLFYRKCSESLSSVKFRYSPNALNFGLWVTIEATRLTSATVRVLQIRRARSQRRKENHLLKLTGTQDNSPVSQNRSLLMC